MAFRVDKDSFYFVLPLTIAGCAFFLFGFTLPGVLCLVLAGAVMVFFRDPRIDAPCLGRYIVSPAFGRVVEIADIDDCSFLKRPAVKVSIFLSLFDCHMNYAPCDGVIEEVTYKRGKFGHAGRSGASENARNEIRIQNGSMPLFMKQIAGLVARRVVCRKKQGDMVKSGEKIGLMRFGSRIELYLPKENIKLTVAINQKVRGPETILGEVLP